jgi:hypothetical protein
MNEKWKEFYLSKYSAVKIMTQAVSRQKKMILYLSPHGMDSLFLDKRRPSAARGMAMPRVHGTVSTTLAMTLTAIKKPVT